MKVKLLRTIVLDGAVAEVGTVIDVHEGVARTWAASGRVEIVDPSTAAGAMTSQYQPPAHREPMLDA